VFVRKQRRLEKRDQGERFIVKISLNYKKASPPLILEEWPRRKLKVTPFLFLGKLPAVKADAGDYAFVVFQIPSERYLLSICRNIKDVIPRTLRVSEHLLQVRD
jgi:hypothetical protein